jgi:ketosteroid isomerase-like protein
MTQITHSEPSPARVARQLLAAGSLTDAAALLAEDVIVRDWLFPGLEIRGRAEVLAVVFEPSDRAFSNPKYEVLRVIANDDHVAVDAIFTGVFIADYKGIRAHGKPVSWQFRDMYRVQGGKITRMWFGTNTLEFATAVGLLEDPLLPWVL